MVLLKMPRYDPEKKHRKPREFETPCMACGSRKDDPKKIRSFCIQCFEGPLCPKCYEFHECPKKET